MDRTKVLLELLKMQRRQQPVSNCIHRVRQFRSIAIILLWSVHQQRTAASLPMDVHHRVHRMAHKHQPTLVRRLHCMEVKHHNTNRVNIVLSFLIRPIRRTADPTLVLTHFQFFCCQFAWPHYRKPYSWWYDTITW